MDATSVNFKFKFAKFLATARTKTGQVLAPFVPEASLLRCLFSWA